VAAKYELKAGITRVQITRADGSTLEVEAGQERTPKDAEERDLLEAHPDVKRVDKGGK